MANGSEDQEFRGRIQRLERLIQGVEHFKDPEARLQTREIVQVLLDMHGVGLSKVLDHVAEAGDVGLSIIDGLARDELVGSLLLLYGLHPLDIDTRVRQALDKVGPQLRSHGGSVELLGIVDGVVRLRMLGSCDGCPSSAVTLKSSIEQAIYEKAPDVAAIVVEQLAETPAVASGLERFALPLLQH